MRRAIVDKGGLFAFAGHATLWVVTGLLVIAGSYGDGGQQTGRRSVQPSWIRRGLNVNDVPFRPLGLFARRFSRVNAHPAATNTK